MASQTRSRACRDYKRLARHITKMQAGTLILIAHNIYSELSTSRMQNDGLASRRSGGDLRRPVAKGLHSRLKCDAAPRILSANLAGVLRSA